MAQLTLVAKPTFAAVVAIPVAGGDAVLVNMTFKHRTKSDLKAFVESREKAADVDSFMDMVQGWELEAPFNRDNVEVLLENYQGTAVCAYLAYLAELTKAKSGN